MVSIGSGDDDISDDDLTDLDKEYLSPDDPTERGLALDPTDFTDLDDQVLRFHREENLRDRYGPLGLSVVTLLHFLPATVALLPDALAVDTTSLAPSIGLDLFFVTGVIAFFSGVAAHLAREYGSRYILRYALGALVTGSAIYVLTVINAAIAPDTFLTAHGVADGIFPQLNTGIVLLSVIGGLLVVARLTYETVSARE